MLLTIYRSARPYTNFPLAASGEFRVQRAVVSKSLVELAYEASHGRPREAGNEQASAMSEKAARESLGALRALNFVEVLRDTGRGRANFYVPHRIEPVVLVPDGLWRQGWINRLTGSALLAFLQVLARQQSALDGVGRISTSIRPLAERGRIVVDPDPADGLDLSDRFINRGIDLLIDNGLVAVVRSRRGGPPERRRKLSVPQLRSRLGLLLVLLDPELLGPPPTAATTRVRRVGRWDRRSMLTKELQAVIEALNTADEADEPGPNSACGSPTVAGVDV
jgi:hypothetical protein